MVKYMKRRLHSITLVLVIVAISGCSMEPSLERQTAEAPTNPPQQTLPPEVEWRETTWVTEIVDTLPISVVESGVRLSNPILALEIAGLQPPKTADEWMSWTPERQNAYWKAREGIPGFGIDYTMRQTRPNWDETFGFGAWDVIALAKTGKKEGVGFQLNILSGQFDPAMIRENLLGLGYEGRIHAGLEYLTLPENRRLKLDWLSDVGVDANVGNVFTDGQIIITAPTAEEMEELLSARGGETPSLGRHPAFGDLVFTMADSLFVSILSRQLLPPPEPQDLGVGSLEKPVEWGSLGNWEALSAAYSRPSPELKRIAFALWYVDMADARDSLPELSRRFDPLDPSGAGEFLYIHEICADFWETETFSSPRGAILEVSCEVEAGPFSEGLGPMMHSMLAEGLVGFIVN